MLRDPPAGQAFTRSPRLASYQGAQVGDQARPLRRLRDELGEASRLILVERNRRSSSAGFVPHTEADATLRHITRHAQSPPAVSIGATEELHNLAPLGRRAPGAVAMRRFCFATALSALRHGHTIRRNHIAKDGFRGVVTAGP
jgi:hypothetical protein